MPFYYLSLQYSAIQKTVNRHNRLWSMAGMSQILSRLNEIDLPNEVMMHTTGDPKVLVAGGGKFTARFSNPDCAEKARFAVTKLIATTLPMLEFQVSAIVEANSLQDARVKGLITQLSEKKNSLRGYGTTYMAHVRVCEECGEYPAEIYKDKPNICRICHQADAEARIGLRERPGLTTLQKIYSKYFCHNKTAADKNFAYNFDHLFSDQVDGEAKAHQRMAVFCSDLNNMNQKVYIWLKQEDDKIPEIFEMVKQTNIDVIAAALTSTFKAIPVQSCLPFRLIVAGGDDLCLVMPEEYVLDFAANLAAATASAAGDIEINPEKAPLSQKWLKENADPEVKDRIGPYSFGASFIVTGIHTPFKRVHEVCEELMKDAKTASSDSLNTRKGNSINWRIMAEDKAVSDHLLRFERPIAMTEAANCIENKLSFEEYLTLRKKYPDISGSHIHSIIDALIDLRQKDKKDIDIGFEEWLKCYDSAEKPKSFSGLLTEDLLRKDGKLVPDRIASLFELKSIKELKTKADSKSVNGNNSAGKGGASQ